MQYYLCLFQHDYDQHTAAARQKHTRSLDVAWNKARIWCSSGMTEDSMGASSTSRSIAWATSAARAM